MRQRLIEEEEINLKIAAPLAFFDQRCGKAPRKLLIGVDQMRHARRVRVCQALGAPGD